MPEVTTVDGTQATGTGSTPTGGSAEDRAAARERDYQKNLNNMKSAKDQQATEHQKAMEAERQKAAAELETERAEKATLNAEATARALEDTAELSELVATMEEAEKKGVDGLPETMTDRAKLKYIKANPALFLTPKAGAKVFGQPTGGGSAEPTDYKPASIEKLTTGGKSGIKAERDRLEKAYGGE